MSWLTPDVVAAVRTHMNDDHADDLLVMVGDPTAVTAEVTGLDHTALYVRIERADGTQEETDLAWPGPLTTRADIRKYVVELHDRAAKGERHT